MSPEKMIMAEIPMIPRYEIKRKIFFLFEIEVLVANNSVMTK